jgi:hypothetical protein
MYVSITKVHIILLKIIGLKINSSFFVENYNEFSIFGTLNKAAFLPFLYNTEFR